jgi:hypothetical protein
MALLDEAMYDGGGIKEEDRISVEKGEHLDSSRMIES